MLTVLFQIARAHGTAHCRGAHNTKPHPTANGGTTTTMTNEEERQGNHDGKGEPRGGGPGRTTRPTTESGTRYAPDAIPTPPTYNPPQTNANPEPAPYRRTKTRTSTSPTDVGDVQEVCFFIDPFNFSTSGQPNDDDDERVPAANAAFQTNADAQKVNLF